MLVDSEGAKIYFCTLSLCDLVTDLFDLQSKGIQMQEEVIRVHKSPTHGAGFSSQSHSEEDMDSRSKDHSPNESEDSGSQSEQSTDSESATSTAESEEVCGTYKYILKREDSLQ